MRLVWAILAIWGALLFWGMMLMMDNQRLIEMTQHEIRYLRTQQEASANTILMLIDEQWSLKERIKQVRAEAWR